MIRRNLYDTELEALTELATLVANRNAAQKACAEAYEAAKTFANRDVTRSRKLITADRDRERAALQSAWDARRKEIEEKFAADMTAAHKRLEFNQKESADRAANDISKAKVIYSDTLWTADSMFEAAERQAQEKRIVAARIAKDADEAIRAARSEMGPILDWLEIKRRALVEEVAIVHPDGASAAADLEQNLANAQESLAALKETAGRDGSGLTHFMYFFLPMLVLSLGAAFLMPKEYKGYFFGVAVLFSFGGGAIEYRWSRGRLRRQARAQSEATAHSLNEAETNAKLVVKFADTDAKAMLADASGKRDAARKAADDKYPPLLVQIEQRRRTEQAAIVERHRSESLARKEAYQQALAAAEAEFAPALRTKEEHYDRLLAEAESLFEERKNSCRTTRETTYEKFATEWRDGQERVGSAFNSLKGEGMKAFPDWDKAIWDTAPAPEAAPPGIRFGTIDLDLTTWPDAIPEQEDLYPIIPVRMKLPAFLPFPDRGSFLLRARDDGKLPAVQALQSMMLRFLTAIPAGKVRFTILDPVGLGENFASFMHLADIDELLVTSRIWTEPAHIERRLADLTAHMENVIQKYLRNQYKSIEEYNTHAGEVAEPYRVLVVSNFPTNFTPEAAKRLVSIAASGPACGVYPIIHFDTAATLPQGFRPEDLEAVCLTLGWRSGQFRWKDDAWKKFPVEVERPPTQERMTQLIRIVGERSRDASRVEVPFDFVAPGSEEIQKASAAGGVRVPVGRSGATKRQAIELGKGTAQHALVAGKTGSGKSTLLHAFIVNAGLIYGPDELEMYLIDFKKGVEFKAYAAGKLPHARVVAIESEREFGLSVLQRLDAILRERGERFRDAGVNDLPDYRAKMPGERCPRILFIVDEFQEFFVVDDRLAQEASLLLDRLVRQGRAFGMHVVLGSQTLGGTYSLARSTIDQMAVRIALQCAEADAQLILSKDNPAARLLTRPGEAIYNDANGQPEGNDLFQVVWLSDERKDFILRDLRLRAERGGFRGEMLVFEGNVPARLESDRALAEALKTVPTSVPKSIRTMLGDAVAIKEPTAALFRPRAGSHLLLIGQNEPLAGASAYAIAVQLRAQLPLSAKIQLIDEPEPNGTHPAELLEGMAGIVRINREAIGPELAALAAEATARQGDTTRDRTPMFLMIHGLHRYRELRKEDEFGFGRKADKIVSAGESLTLLLREGSTVGIHIISWCDTLANLQRACDRTAMREWGMRVLFQMNANDSASLIDGPQAAQLGPMRALYLSDEMTQPEKFRPFGLPSEAWRAGLLATLEDRGSQPA